MPTTGTWTPLNLAEWIGQRLQILNQNIGVMHPPNTRDILLPHSFLRFIFGILVQVYFIPNLSMIPTRIRFGLLQSKSRQILYCWLICAYYFKFSFFAFGFDNTFYPFQFFNGQVIYVLIWLEELGNCIAQGIAVFLHFICNIFFGGKSTMIVIITDHWTIFFSKFIWTDF